MIAKSGALIAYSGSKTGRSPKDKRIVRQADSENDVWWGSVNMPIDESVFAVNRERAIDYLEHSPASLRGRRFCGLGSRSIASRSASSARVPTTRCSCTRC